MNGNHAGLNENQTVNDLLVGRQLAAFVHGLLLAGFGLSTDTPQHTARILEEALDLIVIQDGFAVLIAREHGHALVCYGISAQSCHLILDGVCIRGLAGDELSRDVLVTRPSAENCFDECDSDFDFFHFCSLFLSRCVLVGLSPGCASGFPADRNIYRS